MTERHNVTQGLEGSAWPPVQQTDGSTVSPGAKILRGLVRFYRLFFSAWLGAGCRYVPSCSQYAIGALERHGALGGTYLAAWRVLRCHPGCTGGRDEVPEQLPRPRLFAFLGAREGDAERRLPGAAPISNATTAAGRPSPETLP